jgi:hypothetical protein
MDVEAHASGSGQEIRKTSWTLDWQAGRWQAGGILSGNPVCLHYSQSAPRKRSLKRKLPEMMSCARPGQLCDKGARSACSSLHDETDESSHAGVHVIDADCCCD